VSKFVQFCLLSARRQVISLSGLHSTFPTLVLEHAVADDGRDCGQLSLGIWCELKKDAGIDHRAGWLKSGDGGFETFCRLELAQARADQLEQERNGNPKRIAAYLYRPVKVGSQKNRGCPEIRPLFEVRAERYLRDQHLFDSAARADYAIPGQQLLLVAAILPRPNLPKVPDLASRG
jgi:hypothetical protein